MTKTKSSFDVFWSKWDKQIDKWFHKDPDNLCIGYADWLAFKKEFAELLEKQAKKCKWDFDHKKIEGIEVDALLFAFRLVSPTQGIVPKVKK